MMEGHEWDVLRTCFIQILEDTAFMFAETTIDEDETDETEEMGDNLEEVEISFSGSIAGSLAIVCDEAFMTDLAANILGLDPEELTAGEDKIDALKELLNIICGNFLTAIGGSKEVYDLTIPKLGMIGSIGLLREKMQRVGFFDVDGNNVALALRMES